MLPDANTDGLEVDHLLLIETLGLEVQYSKILHKCRTEKIQYIQNIIRTNLNNKAIRIITKSLMKLSFIDMSLIRFVIRMRVYNFYVQHFNKNMEKQSRKLQNN